MKTQKLSKNSQAKIVPLQGTSTITEKQKKTGMQKVQGVAYPKTAPAPITHEMIAQRAWWIWKSKGCPCGQDEVIWQQAELELKGYQD